MNKQLIQDIIKVGNKAIKVSSIKYTIYTKHDYYYFVADCSGKTYLNKNANGHANTISSLKSAGNWCA